MHLLFTRFVVLGCVPLASACALLMGYPEEPTAPTSTVTEPEPEPSSVAQLPEPPETVPSPEPDASPPEPGILPSGGPTRGRLTKSLIEQGVQSRMQQIQECYALGLSRVPELRGNVMVNFVIAPDGSVPYAAALENGTDLGDPQVLDCVLAEFQKMTFEAPEGGRVVSTYPLRFAPEVSE